MKEYMANTKSTWSSEQIPDEVVDALAEDILKAIKDHISSEE